MLWWYTPLWFSNNVIMLYYRYCTSLTERIVDDYFKRFQKKTSSRQRPIIWSPTQCIHLFIYELYTVIIIIIAYIYGHGNKNDMIKGYWQSPIEDIIIFHHILTENQQFKQTNLNITGVKKFWNCVFVVDFWIFDFQICGASFYSPLNWTILFILWIVSTVCFQYRIWSVNSTINNIFYH